MKTLNDHVAVKPFDLDHKKGTNLSSIKGFAGSDKTLRTIISSSALFDSEKIKAGQKIYFKAEISALPQSKNILIHKNGEEEVEFILLPESLILGVE